MVPDDRPKDVHVHKYVRVRNARQERVRAHWRRKPRQLRLPGL